MDYSGCNEFRKVPEISDQNRSHFQIQHVRKHKEQCKNVKNQNKRVFISTDEMCPIDQENDIKRTFDVFRKHSLVLIFHVTTYSP